MELTVDGIDIGSFKFERLVYETTIGEDLTTVTVRARPVSHSASVEFSHDDADPATTAHEVTLERTGSTEISITVRNPDDSSDFTTYSVTLIKVPGTTHPLSSNAHLKTFAIGEYGTIPRFTRTQYNYHTTLATAIQSVILSVATFDAEANYTISLPDSDDLTDGYQIAVGADGAIVTVVVTAEDGVTTRTYNLAINRPNAVRNARITMTLPNGCFLRDLDQRKEYSFADDCDSLYRDAPQRAARYFRIVVSDGGPLRLFIGHANYTYAAFIVLRSASGEVIDVAGKDPPRASSDRPKLNTALPAGVYIVEVVSYSVYDEDSSFRLEYSGDVITRQQGYELRNLEITKVPTSGFRGDKGAHLFDVAEDVGTVTVLATPQTHGATVGYSPADADLRTPGHQLTLEETGDTTFTLSLGNPISLP